MRYRLKVYCIWEPGKRKDADGNPHQEDSVFPSPDRLNPSDRTFILCDGMGGHDAGEIASATVCRTMGKAIIGRRDDAEREFTNQDLVDAISAAFDALDREDNGAEKKMGTTMAFLKLHNGGATIAHIGDSRVYHIRPGQTGEDTEILFETQDHSLVNDLVRVGELTKEEAHFSKQKNVITRAMQPHMSPRPKADIHHVTDIRPGDYFYLCSDGMLEQADMDNGTTLRNIFSEQGGPDSRRVKILREVTSGNSDNHTAIIIHITEVTDSIVPTVCPPQKFRNSMAGIMLRALLVAAIVAAGIIYIRSVLQSHTTPHPVDGNDTEVVEIDDGILEQPEAENTRTIQQKDRPDMESPLPDVSSQSADSVAQIADSAMIQTPGKTEAVPENINPPVVRVIEIVPAQTDDDVIDSDQQSLNNELTKEKRKK